MNRFATPRLARPTHSGLGAAKTRAQGDHTQRQLIEWVREYGGTFGPIELREVDGLRGLHATRDIDAGAPVVFIPTALTITSDTATECPLGRLVADSGLKISERGQIAVLLLSTRRDGGFWSPCVLALPGALPEHPLCVDAALIDEGLGAFGIAHAVLAALRAECQADLEAVHAALAGADGPAADEFAWAFACAASRTFKPRHSQFALVPLVDMINHRVEPSAACECDARGVTVRACRRIACGAEISIDYGPRSNAHLFPMYGFCHVESPLEEAPIFTPAGCFPVSTVYSSERARKLFTALRAASPDAPHPHRGEPGELAPSDRRNEISALTLLRDASQWRIDNFETALEQDDALIHAGDLTRLERNIVLTRRSEKRVLGHYLELAHAALGFLADPSAVAADELRTRIGDDAYAAELLALSRT
jgi:hypothetical protein